MKTIKKMFVTAVLLSICTWGQAEDMIWYIDYQVALKEARDIGKPLLVAFRCVP